MPTLYATRGLSGSGKSTLALEMVRANPKLKRVNRDSIRTMIHGDKWSQSREKLTVKTRDTLISLYLSEGFDVISDDTNLDPSVMARLEQLATLHGAKFEVIDLTDVPYEECVKRDLSRLNSVGEQVIKKQWLNYLCAPIQQRDRNLPDCVIVDLDGTLADISHRSPYDASTCDEDGYREHVVAIINGYVQEREQLTVFAFSGREDTHYDKTWNWLSDEVCVDHLYMRKAGDTRRDSIVKRELYEEHIKGKFNVFAVVDDRPQVLRLWRSLGLPTIDVSEKLGLEF